MVFGPCDRVHRDVGRQPNGDHVFLQALADTDAGVEAAGNDLVKLPVGLAERLEQLRKKEASTSDGYEEKSAMKKRA